MKSKRTPTVKKTITTIRKVIKITVNIIIWVIAFIPVIIFIKLFDIAEYLRHRRSKKFYSKIYENDKETY